MSPMVTTASCICAENISRSAGSRALSLSIGMKALSEAGQALDIGAARFQLFLEQLEAAVEMIDTMERGLALGGKVRDDERHRGPEIGRHHLGAGQLFDAADLGRIAVEMDVGAEACKLLHMHEAVLEDRLADDGGALGLGGQRHELGLEIGGEARIRLGLDLDWSKS